MNEIKSVFNNRKWRAAGGDVGDNSCFYEDCEILRVEGNGSNQTASVRWPDGSVTHGHFTLGMRDVETDPTTTAWKADQQVESTCREVVRGLKLLLADRYANRRQAPVLQACVDELEREAAHIVAVWD